MGRVVTSNDIMYRKLKCLTEMLNAEAKLRDSKKTFWIGNCYEDYGAEIMWTTIMSISTGSWGGEYQLLSPREWKEIDLANSVEELTEVFKEIITDKYFHW